MWPTHKKLDFVAILYCGQAAYHQWTLQAVYDFIVHSDQVPGL